MKLRELFHRTKKTNFAATRFGDEKRGFLYTTKGGSSPRNKARVFLSIHSNDIPVCFNDIVRDIFAVQNCVICYRDPLISYTNQEAEKLFKNAFELFVIPVTRRLLSTENQALNCDLPYAVRNKIPVLPIVLEEGLDKAFSEVFGDMQYLLKVKGAHDPTALSYEEKLRSYLAKILSDDSESRKIREAFDSYLFLSYRKKDREHANRLKQLVHKIAAYRDVAIWYDEYLVPGENFNDMIASMLKKCKAMLLAVTPNLVNEENYVQSVEYKLAHQQKKSVLPVEMVALSDSEKEQLVEQYKDIPECIDPADDAAIAGGMAALLGEKNAAFLRNDAEHTFRIGLAYLKGIDVETDHDKALHMITEAAEAGLPEAQRKLAYMYIVGEGVSRDRTEAEKWLLKLKEACGAGYSRQSDSRNARMLYDAMDELYRLYRDYGPHAKMEPVCDDILAFLDGKSYAWSGEARAEYLANKGFAAYKVRNVMTAEECYRQALQIAADPFLKAMLYERLSILMKNSGRSAEARKNILKAVEIRREIATPESAAHYRSSLALTLIYCGDLEREAGDPDKAEPYYLDALDRYRHLYEESGSIWDQDGIGVCQCALGEICCDKERRNEYYREALDIYDTLFKSTGMPVFKLKRGICLLNLKGIDAVAESIGYKPQAEETEDSEKLAENAEADGDFRAASEYWKEHSRNLERKIEEGNGDFRTLSLNYRAEFCAGRCLFRCGEDQKARESLERTRRSISGYESVHGCFFVADVPDQTVRSVCAAILLEYAAHAVGDDAIKWYDDCIDYLHNMYEKTGDKQVLAELEAVYLKAAAHPSNPNPELYTEEAERVSKM